MQEYNRVSDRNWSMFDLTPGFVAVLSGPDHVYTYVNPAHARLLGGRDVSGKAILDALPEVIGQGIVEILDNCFKTGEPYRATAMPVTLPSEAGALEERSLDFVYQPFYSQDGSVEGIFVEGIDVTDHIRTERALRTSEAQARLVLEILKSLRDLTHPDDIMSLTAGRLAAFLQVNRCGFFEVEPDEGIVFGPSWSDGAIPELEKRWPFSNLGKAYLAAKRAGENPLVGDMEANPLTQDALFAKLGIRAGFSASIRRSDKWVGGLFVHHSELRVWTAEELNVVQELAELTWDAVDRVRVATALGESKARQLQGEQRINQLMSNTLDAVVIIDQDGTVTDWNSQAEGIFGWAESDVLGRCLTELIVPPEQRLAHQEGMRRYLQTGIPSVLDRRIEVEALRRDGTRFPLELTISALVQKHGTYFSAFGRDITAQRDAVRAIEAAREAAEAANVAKTEFLANMSHEIRTPMNAIVGLSSILGHSANLSAKEKQFVHTLQLSADALLTLINDLLDISKIEAMSVDLESVPFSIDKVVHEVISIMSVRAGEKGLSFHLRNRTENLGDVIGDPTRFRQIILNLCSNAIKFTEIGGVEIEIGCEHSDVPNVVMMEIKVTDTGIGISNDKLPFVFDKFVQADNTITRKYGGSGLGLTITRTLAELMGGRVSATSEVGKGSSFIVHIPFKHEGAPPICDQESETPAMPVGATRAEKTVLLVEDYEPNIMVAQHFLEMFGYQVEIARNGADAIDMARLKVYAAILMDVQMPGMNGYEATSIIRAHEHKTARQAVPIIGITAHAIAGDRERCLAAGMDDYLAKPYQPEVLQEILKDLIDQRVDTGS